MSDTQALERLIEAVGAGTASDTSGGSHGREMFFDAFPPWETDLHDCAFNAYNSSLDAAKALHDALLPGWGYQIGPLHARVVNPSDAILDQSGGGENGARAWLLAVLRAKLAAAS